MLGEAIKNELLAAIYDGIFDQERWHEGIAIAAKAVAAETVTYWLHDKQRACVQCIGALGMEGLNLRQYEEYYHTKDLWTLAAQASPNKVWMFHEIVPQKDLERSEIRNEYGNPAGVDIYWGIGGYFELGSAGALAYGFHRSVRRQNWTGGEQRLARWLSTHIQRSARTLLQLQPVRDGLSQLTDVFDQLPDAIVVIGGSGRLAYQNVAAERMFLQGNLVRATGGRLAAVSADDNLRLQAAIGAAAGAQNSGPGIASRTYLLGNYAATPCAVTCAPLRNHLPHELSGTRGVLVTISTPRSLDDDARAAVFRKRYGLTTAELRLTLRLVAGETLPEASSSLGISSHTGRAQIKSIFQKVGVHSQVELLSTMLR